MTERAGKNRSTLICPPRSLPSRPLSAPSDHSSILIPSTSNANKMKLLTLLLPVMALAAAVPQDTSFKPGPKKFRLQTKALTSGRSQYDGKSPTLRLLHMSS